LGVKLFSYPKRIAGTKKPARAVGGIARAGSWFSTSAVATLVDGLEKARRLVGRLFALSESY